MKRSRGQVGKKSCSKVKIMEVRHTCYQLMCEGGPINFISVLDILENWKRTYKEINLTTKVLYGRNGFKTKLEYSKGMEMMSIGSIHSKFEHVNGNKISVIMFRSGKIKVSGGLVNNKKGNDEEYIKEVVNVICDVFTGEECIRYKMSLLNGISRISMTPQRFRKFLYEVQESKKFDKVKEPTFTGRGNITCGRIYPYEGRKSHISIDPKGGVQLFAFRSFEEVKQVVKMFEECVST